MLSIGMNRKLKRGNIGIFNLPARLDVCGRDCPSCYAKKSQKMYKRVLPYRLANLAASRDPTFAIAMVTEIVGLRRPLAAIRVHESGDFYDQAYVDAWVSIAAQLPLHLFYVYTKRITDFAMGALQALPNVVVIDSCQYGPVNYGDPAFVAAMAAKGAFVCPASDTVSCNFGCNYCLTKAAQATGVVFHKH